MRTNIRGNKGKLGIRLFLLLALAILPAFAPNLVHAALSGGYTGTDAAAAQGGYTGADAAAQGGYAGPGPAIVSVQQALSMRDDSWVSLKGRIVQSLGDEEYVFRDATGEVTVDIDSKVWMGQSVGPDDMVEIHGEVDKDWTHTEIEVKRLLKRP